MTGFLRPVGDVDGLAEALLILLNDRERAHEMGAAGRRRAQRCFQAADIALRYEKVYRSVLAGEELRPGAPCEPETVAT